MSFIDKKMKRKEEKVQDNIFLSLFYFFISQNKVGGVQARDTVSLGASTYTKNKEEENKMGFRKNNSLYLCGH